MARFLRFVQPTRDKQTLDFMKTSADICHFFSQLEQTGMDPATILNSMTSIVRFQDFLKSTPDFEMADKGHRNRCDRFKEFIQTLRKPVSKSLSQKTVEER